ncbi:MAG: thymidine phosphorylase [Planctomycetota bacterium]
MRAHPARLIAKKRDGGRLSTEEIADLIGGVTDGQLEDAQLGAWLMAVCCRGMDVQEVRDLTLAMRDSGSVFDLAAVPGRKIDKHSTGGVGDKVSLLLAPWVAAAGVPVPMVSGRGLGHTGGTLDKLAAVPGYRTDLSATEFAGVLADCGFVMAGQSEDLAPADRRMYATRDVCGTVESVPLITASILSKKLAEGIDGLVLDVKCGRAAFMRTRAGAEELLQSLVATGRAAGLDVVALLTEMDTPLGRAVGNALEVAEIVACLRGEGPGDLMEVTRALAAEMVVLGGRATDRAAAETELDRLLASGAVEECLRRNVRAQGGDPGFLDDPTALPRAPATATVVAATAGTLCDVDALAIGNAVVDLGGGRRRAADSIDPRVGVVLQAAVGDAVRGGQPFAEVHAADRATADATAAHLAAAFRVGPSGAGPASRILGRWA